MKVRRAHFALFSALFGCAGTPAPELPARVAATSSTAASASSSPTQRTQRTNVEIAVRTAKQVRYAPNLLGAGRPPLRITLKNPSSRSIDISDLSVRLRVEHDGVAFRCSDEAPRAPRSREPMSLAPGSTATFERSVDCSLPLVGAYVMNVAVSFGSGPSRMTLDGGALKLVVSAPSHSEPRRLEGFPGLWGAVGAGSVIPGTTPGPGRIAFALVNATSTPLELPRLRLGLRVYRTGVPIPCEDDPVRLATPAVLGAGAVHQEPVDVSCLGLSSPGSYEIVARVLGDIGPETDVGRLRVDVSDDPATTSTPRWHWQQ